MFDFAAEFAKNPNGVLATKSGAGIRTRVFQYLFTDGKKIYFCTSSEKDVYRELAADAHACFCSYPADFTPVVSVNGKTVFVEDPALKARVLDENPMIKGIYQSADNPVFKVFYIDAETVETFSFAKGPKKYAF